MKHKISVTINEKTLSQVLGLVDGVRINGLSQAIEYLLEKALIDQRIAVIMATTPPKKEHATDFEERPLLKVEGKTIIEHAVQKLSESKFKKIFIVGGHNLLTKVYSVIGDGSSFGVEIKY
ncbi:MAG: hypothetical protein NTY48_04145, partial [Candidatus Diapherotrites archaeon]|nr:hypothetical protein [Candidatus Diapherotrites archaeon]